MLVDDAHDKRLIENCHPPDWVNPTPAGKYNLIVIRHEKEARAAGFNVATITESLTDVDGAVLDGEDEGFARVHYDKKTGRILGGTLVARHAGEMINELTLAMVAKQSVSVLSSTIHSYPTQAEVWRKIGDGYMFTKLTPTVKKVFERWLMWRR